MVRQILFAPDSELVVPGRSGARAALGELERQCAQQLREALAETRAECVRVFASATSRFDRPLPGFSIAQRLLENAGYSGEIRKTAPTDDLAAGETSSEALWLVLGTGAACHGDGAPLIADGTGVEIDAQLERALASATPCEFVQIKPESARTVGATILEPAALAVHALSPGEAATWIPGELFTQSEFGVTYFVARWYARGERD